MNMFDLMRLLTKFEYCLAFNSSKESGKPDNDISAGSSKISLFLLMCLFDCNKAFDICKFSYHYFGIRSGAIFSVNLWIVNYYPYHVCTCR